MTTTAIRTERKLMGEGLSVVNWNSVVSVLCAVVGAAFFGHMVGTIHTQQKAITAGVGRWIVNAKTGVTSFEFLSAIAAQETKLQLQSDRNAGSLSSRASSSAMIGDSFDDPQDLGLVASRGKVPAERVVR